MLKIKDIRKEYKTGSLTQTALDSVSLSFRDSEFVAVLGPSGSGKTTLLNIIGGLDRYDSGDLMINGISTKKYKDRDWDSYRNHTIGFVFQSYNLIPHQSVLANVELALTISGVSRSERKKRAKEALKKVGLGDHIHKRPNQMSGGQMQRVAIARALVNDPDILLADEPTGALDSETSVQVMELLAEVAKDRLVIMVTHNPELADQYATRIVRLKDGRITDDSDPFEEGSGQEAEPVHKSMGKSSMSIVTSLGLSFNNLRTKKGRTILTSFAGSIGIIGIALILSLSNGVKNYINDIQRSTMASYPITIESKTMDMSSIMGTPGSRSGGEKHDNDGVYVDGSDLEESAAMSLSVAENNLTAFKKYLDDESSEIHKYVGENGIVYSYDTKCGIFTYDDEGEFVNTNGSTLSDDKETKFGSITSSYTSGISGFFGGDSQFDQLIAGSDGSQVGTAIRDNFEVVYGRFPEKYDEIVLVLDENNELSSQALYQLGILPTSEYRDIMERIDDGESYKAEVRKLDYAAVCAREYRLIPQCDMYIKNANGLYDDISEDNLRLEGMYEQGLPLKIVGIIKPSNSNASTLIGAPIAYTKALTDYLIDYTNNSEVVKEQLASPEINVTNGMRFAPDSPAEKAEDAKIFISNMNTSDKAELYEIMTGYLSADISSELAELGDLSELELPEGMEIPPEMLGEDGSLVLDGVDTSGMSETEKAEALDEFLADPDEEMLIMVYDMYVSSGDHDDMLSAMGVVSLDAPSSIDIYADNFEDKDEIARCIEDYNSTVDEEDRITYTDFVGLLMSSVTNIINIISYVLIAFVAVSLVVSSIMIGIITYISVLERTKEIGILRAMGASKRNISQVFNAETMIIGFFAGLIGIGITLLFLIPVNAVIHQLTDSASVNASLPVTSAVILILLSTSLTLVGGFIPAKKAAKKDPVTALRTE